MAFYADTKNYFAKKYEPESNKIIRADESEEDNKKRVHAYIMLNWKLFDELGAQTALADDNNLSVRFPLCDDKLIEYVWNIPYTMKTLGCRDKGIFRLAMKGILPDDVIARRKRTPPMPYTNWLNDMIKARIEAILNDSQSPIGRMISNDALNINELAIPNSSRKLPAIEFMPFTAA